MSYLSNLSRTLKSFIWNILRGWPSSPTSPLYTVAYERRYGLWFWRCENIRRGPFLTLARMRSRMALAEAAERERIRSRGARLHDLIDKELTRHGY